MRTTEQLELNGLFQQDKATITTRTDGKKQINLLGELTTAHLEALRLRFHIESIKRSGAGIKMVLVDQAIAKDHAHMHIVAQGTFVNTRLEGDGDKIRTGMIALLKRSVLFHDMMRSVLAQLDEEQKQQEKKESKQTTTS